jgi:biopolymer transport protein ExbD
MSSTAWEIRHAGSPKSKTNVSANRILAGVAEGRWDPSDEVRAMGSTRWQPLEEHPQFAEVVEELTTPPPKPPVDETRLDMNPLIDVALVLLIFFILTTTYEQIRKVLDIPPASNQREDKKLPTISEKDLNATIQVLARTEDGKPVVRVEQEPTPEEQLTDKIREWVRKTGKKELFIDAMDVPWGTIVAILDAAKGAGIQKQMLKSNKP